ncbi:MAG: hypothetical protein IJ115_06095 [Erysipelotrichaceae bacterium]|nr:hypothetical protein [Erysipelotrichaceae bacterium]
MKKVFDNKTEILAIVNIAWNIIYGIFNLVMMSRSDSYWYLAIGIFFLVLGLMRLMGYVAEKKKFSNVNKYVGIVMLLLAVALNGINIITIKESINPGKNMILVIAQAAFTFTVFVLAIINVIHANNKKDIYMLVNRNIAFASAISSMLSLERSMLGTFGVPADAFNTQIETYTGGAAFILLIILGIGMLKADKWKKNDRTINS